MPGFNKIAIADPAVAPYGAAAVETMKKLGLYETLSGKIVQGTDIGQAFQFVDTGSAEIGFVALSEVAGRSDGSRWIVPANLYNAILQDAVLLRSGVNPAAEAFVTFLKGPEARKVIDVGGDAPRLVAGQQLCRRLSAGLILEIDVSQ